MTISIQESYRVVVPDRFLTIQYIDDIVTIHHNNDLLISTDYALRLLEGDRAGVIYVPLNEICGATLSPSDTQYLCRWKGDAAYYHVHMPDGTVVPDGAWSYPEAPDEIALLRQQVSFDTSLFSENIVQKEKAL